MVSYVNLPDSDLTEKNLINDEEFMGHIRNFLVKRNNQVFTTRKEAFDAYLDHMRKSKVGDVTPLFDYQYAQDADEETKREFAGIRNVFDRYSGDEDFLSKETFDKVMDYAIPLINPLETPSTLVGLGTAGAGGVALKAGIQGAKFGLTKLLAQALKGAIRPAAVEGVAGTIVGAAKGDTERLLGEGGNWKTGAATEGFARGAGALVGGGFLSGLASRKAYKLGSTVFRSGKEAQESAAEEALKQTEKILKKDDPFAYIKGEADVPEDEAVARFANDLKALDEDRVASGIKIKRTIGPDDPDLIAGLDRETINAIGAAASEIGRLVGWKASDPRDRITQRVSDAIDRGSLEDGTSFSHEILDGIAERYNLTREDLANLWAAEFSEAGRTLRTARKIKEAGQTEAIKRLESNIEKTVKFISDVSPATRDALEEQIQKLSQMGNTVDKFFQKVFAGAQSANKLRLGLMTSKLATTIRNAANVALRLPLHMIEYMGTGGSIVDAAKIPYGLFNKAEAEALADAFHAANPTLMKQIFRSAMDIEQKGGVGKLAKLGRGVNVLNTYLDNTVKKTVLLGEFRKIARAENKDLFNDIIANGQLKQFLIKNRKQVQNATDETLALVYQKGYKKDSFAGKFIDLFAQSKWSLVLSLLVPFPRYLANQTEFIYKHTPVLGAIQPVSKVLLGKGLAPGELRKSMMQQVSGLGMIYTAMQLKIVQGPETPWNQHRDPDTKQITDITALLGPFAPTFFAVDMWYRLNEGNFDLFGFTMGKENVRLKAPTKFKEALRSGIQAFSGLQARGSTGAYFLDNLIEDVGNDIANLGSEKDEISRPAWKKIRNKVGADWFNTFTLPFGMLTELQATFDVEGRKIMDNDRIDLNQYFWNYALRSLPNNQAMKNTEEFFGVNLGLANLLETARGQQIEQEFPGEGGPRRRFAPFVREMTGLTPIYGFRGKPLLEKELTRLGFERKDWTPRHKSPAIERHMKSLLGIHADNQITAVINSDVYRNATVDMQKQYLDGAIREFKIKVKEDAEAMATDQLGTEVDRMKFESKGRDLRNLALEKYEEIYGKSLVEDEAWRFGLRLIRTIERHSRFK